MHHLCWSACRLGRYVSDTTACACLHVFLPVIIHLITKPLLRTCYLQDWGLLFTCPLRWLFLPRITTQCLTTCQVLPTTHTTPAITMPYSAYLPLLPVVFEDFPVSVPCNRCLPPYHTCPYLPACSQLPTITLPPAYLHCVFPTTRFSVQHTTYPLGLVLPVPALCLHLFHLQTPPLLLLQVPICFCGLLVKPLPPITMHCVPLITLPFIAVVLWFSYRYRAPCPAYNIAVLVSHYLAVTLPVSVTYYGVGYHWMVSGRLRLPALPHLAVVAYCALDTLLPHYETPACSG